MQYENETNMKYQGLTINNESSMQKKFFLFV